MAAVAVQPQQMIGQWQVKKPLGKGAFSEVFKVVHSVSGQIAAAKITRSTNPKVERNYSYDDCECEADFLVTLTQNRIPNVVKYLDKVDGFKTVEDWTLTLIIEYIPGRDLSRQFLHGKRGLNAEEALTVLEGGLETLNALSPHKIVHGDIAPRNIMLYGHTVKIIDWVQAHNVKDRPKSRTGTFCYASIEMLLLTEWTTKTDLFSLSSTILCSITQTRLVEEAAFDNPFKILDCMQHTCEELIPSSMIEQRYAKQDSKTLEEQFKCGKDVDGKPVYSLKPTQSVPPQSVSKLIQPFLAQKPEIAGEIYKLLRKMLVFDPAKRIDAKTAYQEVLEIRKKWQ